ncbi:restriction endonuclease subunit S [Blastococcus brunescens]|uniref:Restriction endonuclease subunit S n=1 Tax=Blastococcus brunescens TaxID=1564165 RepID=A0ABZ1BAJ4_9ACTN|nr:restriction endonuclease subunit S [Blastococcus sp. BMG 8361]WRL66856.1 restriction endonuclease subunit S [Blastococcus sp. BMG 8361]
MDEAETLRAKRRRVLALINDLTQSAFVEMFGDPIRNLNGLALVPLGELGRLDRGVSRHRPRNDPALLGGRYPLIQTGEVASSGGFIREYSSTYSELGLAQSRLWPAGTLCITIAANIAKTGILTFDACFPDSIVGFTADKEMTNYVRVWLTFLQATLEASAPQSAQKNINLAILRSLPVPVPSSRQLAAFSHVVDVIEERRIIGREAEAATAELVTSLRRRAFATVSVSGEPAGAPAREQLRLHQCRVAAGPRRLCARGGLSDL